MVHFIKIDACTREVLFRHFIKSVSHAGQAFCKQHTSGAAGIEMALPGDCPVKQSFTTDLLREKGARKKKNSKWFGNISVEFKTGHCQESRGL